MKHNVYFGGKVQSLGVSADGTRKTVGVIAPGVFEFGTGAAERMHVVAGTLYVKLPGQDDFRPYLPGTRFDVPANSSFQVRASADVAYLCEYFD
jgi:purine/pyrimidine-nucleoside phosphorylase